MGLNVQNLRNKKIFRNFEFFNYHAYLLDYILTFRLYVKKQRYPSFTNRNIKKIILQDKKTLQKEHSD